MSQRERRVRALPERTRVVLLDVEGTVGDVTFVQRVLFPYARERMASFVARHASAPEVEPILAEAARLAGVAADDRDAIVRALLSWSDANAKVGPFKALQGVIWRDGYAQGALRAPVYDDVPVSLRAWRESGVTVAIYSSGSVLAQRLYFASSSAGDLTPLLTAYFDTAVGAKGDAESYARIAAALGVVVGDVCFFSDAPAEVDAARAAGMTAVRVDRTRGPWERGRDDAGNEWWGGIGEERGEATHGNSD